MKNTNLKFKRKTKFKKQNKKNYQKIREHSKFCVILKKPKKPFLGKTKNPKNKLYKIQNKNKMSQKIKTKKNIKIFEILWF